MQNTKTPKPCARCNRPLNNINKSEWSLCYLCQGDLAASGKKASESPKLVEWIDAGAPKISRCTRCNMGVPMKEAAQQEGRCARHFEILGKSRASIGIARAYRKVSLDSTVNLTQDKPKITNNSKITTLEGKIEKGVPLPSVRGKLPATYPWKAMKVTDSFWMAKASNRASKLAYDASKEFKMKYTVRREGKGTRVWRIK